MSNKKVVQINNQQIVDLLTEGGIKTDEVLEMLKNIYGPNSTLADYLVIKGGCEYYKSIGYMPNVALQKIREEYYKCIGYLPEISLNLMEIEDYSITFNIFEGYWGGIKTDEVLEMLEDVYGPHDAQYNYLVIKGGYEYYKSIGYLPNVALQKIRSECRDKVGYMTDIFLHYMKIEGFENLKNLECED